MARRSRRYRENEGSLLTLSILHYVYGGFALLCIGGYGAVYLFLGVVFLGGGPNPPPNGPPPEFFGWMFTGLGGCMTSFGLIGGGFSIATGWNLSKRSRWSLCFFTACLNCIGFPFGTILAIFTLIVLHKDLIKEEFGVIPRPEGWRDDDRDREYDDDFEDDRSRDDDRPRIEDSRLPPHDDGKRTDGPGDPFSTGIRE